MSTLTDLIQNQKDDIDAEHQKVADGQAAQAKLRELQGVHDDLVAVKALLDAQGQAATARVTAAKAAVGKLPTDFAAAVSGVSALLAKKGVTAATLAAAVTNEDLPDPPDPTRKKHKDYSDAKKAADDKVATALKDLLPKRLAAAAARQKVDEKAAELTRSLETVETWLARARELYVTAGTRVQAGDAAGAWWAIEQTTSLRTRVTAADPATLVAELGTACDAYATAADAALKAEQALETATAEQAKAASELKVASERLLTLLRSKIPSP